LNDVTLYAEGPTPACPFCRCGENKLLAGGISIVSDTISASYRNQKKQGHLGAMTIAAAPDCLSFAAKS
jgi:hypothetical protein